MVAPLRVGDEVKAFSMGDEVSILKAGNQRQGHVVRTVLFMFRLRSEITSGSNDRHVAPTGASNDSYVTHV